MQDVQKKTGIMTGLVIWKESMNELQQITSLLYEALTSYSVDEPWTVELKLDCWLAM